MSYVKTVRFYKNRSVFFYPKKPINETVKDKCIDTEINDTDKGN